jgi:hypothetical protein
VISDPVGRQPVLVRTNIDRAELVLIFFRPECHNVSDRREQPTDDRSCPVQLMDVPRAVDQCRTETAGWVLQTRP